jgi:hypothetical protein
MMHTLYDEQRLVSRVLHHWRKMAIGRNLPSKDHIDPWLIGDDWSHCMLLTLDVELRKSIFLAVGDNLLPAGTPSLNFKPISECPNGTILAAMLGELERSVSSVRPISITGGTLHLAVPVMFRAVLLPLSDYGSQIDSIFGVANFRPMAADENVDRHGITVRSLNRSAFR